MSYAEHNPQAETSFPATCVQLQGSINSYDLLMWPRGEAEHMIKRNSGGRLQNWLVILGPCSENTAWGPFLFIHSAQAVVFNYGWAVKTEAVTLWLFFSFCFKTSEIKINVGCINNQPNISKQTASRQLHIYLLCFSLLFIYFMATLSNKVVLDEFYVNGLIC